MNRTIEFRIWDISAQEYMKQVRVPTYAFNILEAENSEWMYESSKNLVSLAWALENTQDFEAQQFTGLLDINDRKIFEGDIIETTQYIFGPRSIFWDDRRSNYSISKPVKKEDEGYFEFLTDMNIKQWGVKVIGNIKENPELLKTAN